jgi:hypothetical protein
MKGAERKKIALGVILAHRLRQAFGDRRKEPDCRGGKEPM